MDELRYFAALMHVGFPTPGKTSIALALNSECGKSQIRSVYLETQL